MADSGNYDENSSAAVLRVALAVAFSDDMLDLEELGRVEEVYRDILERMDEQDEDLDVGETSDEVSQDVRDTLAAMDTDSDRDELYAEWAEAVTDPDLQEIALVAALVIAADESEIDPDEAECMNAFCDNWNLDLEDVLRPFREE